MVFQRFAFWMNRLCRAAQLAYATPVLLMTGHAFAGNTLFDVLIRAGDPYPALGKNGGNVSSIDYVWVNQVGGFSVLLNNKDTIAPYLNYNVVWGRANSNVVPHVLVAEGASDQGFTTTAIREAFIDNAGNVLYEGPPGSGLRSLWRNETLLYNQGDPIPNMPGSFFGGPHFIGPSADGSTYYFRAGHVITRDERGGGLGFFNQDGELLMEGGEFIPGYNSPIAFTSTSISRAGVSANGTNYVNKVVLQQGVGDALVMNGAPLYLQDEAVFYFALLDPDIPGVIPGERWERFDTWQVSESGNVMLAGTTTTPAKDATELLYINGSVVQREGDLVPSYSNPSQYFRLHQRVNFADMNEDGDWIASWNLTNNLPALILNGVLIARDGQQLDFDGDGSFDARIENLPLAELHGAITDRDQHGRVSVYFTALVSYYDMPGPSVETLFRSTYTVPTPAALTMLLIGAFVHRPRRREH